MKSRTDMPLPKCELQAGEQYAGFVIERVVSLPEVRCTACQARHAVSGARFLHLLAADDENLFAVAFRTPPWNKTGMPHILEHSVLDGSEKFPVKEPFVEMLKSSMATFINAMTYPDRTVYPVASNVRRDFFNLADVYFDAVFHPRLTPQILQQEGWHLEFVDPHDLNSDLTIQGIVYNEMKGSYADLDSAIDRIAGEALFPDTPYGFDSGGDPDAIPELTYARFIDYYRNHYQPGNAYFLVYGNIATTAHLTFLDERLQGVSRGADGNVPPIPVQPRWSEPREICESYPIAADESPDRKSAVTLNWVVGHVADDMNELGLEVVEQLLLGSAAAPLRKALIDSHLGDDLTPSGFSGGTLESTFHIGLKGTDPDQKEAICELVMKTLEMVCAKGFSDEQVDTAFQQLQYSYREIKSSYPLHLMDTVFSVWLYGLDPLLAVQTGEKLDQLYRQYQDDQDIFTNLIRLRLLENPHHLTAVFVPDGALQQQKDAEARKKLALRKQSMSYDEVRQLATQAEQLQILQEAPNSVEQLATLPRLSIQDLPKYPKPIPTELIQVNAQTPLLHNHVFANGVNYLLLGFDLDGLEPELQAYVPVFAALLNKVGTKSKSYVELAEFIAAKTGGFGAGTFTGVDAWEAQQTLKYLTLQFKALDATFEDVLRLVVELLNDLDLSAADRLHDVLVQRRIRMRSAIIPNGHRIAAQHAARTLSPLAGVGELWGGLPQIRLAAEMVDCFPGNLELIKEKVEKIRLFIVNHATVKASFTGSDRLLGTTVDFLQQLGQKTEVQAGLHENAACAAGRGGAPLLEGLAVPSDVAYCALCMRAPHISDPVSPELQLFTQLLSYDYLWEEVRVKGGAYGGFISYDSAAGILELVSYRDPHITRTLDVYRGMTQYIERISWTKEQISQAMISCAKNDEKPIRPGWATHASLWRYVGRLTEEFRCQYRERLLAVEPDAVKNAALELLKRELPAANICVLADRQKLQDNTGRQYPLTIENISM